MIAMNHHHGALSPDPSVILRLKDRGQPARLRHGRPLLQKLELATIVLGMTAGGAIKLFWARETADVACQKHGFKTHAEVFCQRAATHGASCRCPCVSPITQIVELGFIEPKTTRCLFVRPSYGRLKLSRASSTF